jgi:hypothetical protein
MYNILWDLDDGVVGDVFMTTTQFGWDQLMYPADWALFTLVGSTTVTEDDFCAALGVEGESVIGDVNSDDSIDVFDATLINLIVLMGAEGLDTYLAGQGMDPICEPCADVDTVDGVTVLDATLVNLVVLMGKDSLNAYLSGLGMDPVHTGEPITRQASSHSGEGDGGDSARPPDLQELVP